MQLGIERFAYRVDLPDLETCQRFHKALQRELHALVETAHLLALGIRNGTQGPLQVVEHRQQFAAELFEGELVGFFDIAFAAATHVLHFGLGTQHRFTLLGERRSHRLLDARSDFDLRFDCRPASAVVRRVLALIIGAVGGRGVGLITGHGRRSSVAAGECRRIWG